MASRPNFRFITTDTGVGVALYGLRSKGGQPVGRRWFPTGTPVEDVVAHLDECVQVHITKTRLPERKSPEPA